MKKRTVITENGPRYDGLFAVEEVEDEAAGAGAFVIRFFQSWRYFGKIAIPFLERRF